MKIEQAIEILRQAKEEGVKNIIFAYWGAEIFSKQEGEEWEYYAEQIEDRMDWSSTHDLMSHFIQDIDEEWSDKHIHNILKRIKASGAAAEIEGLHEEYIRLSLDDEADEDEVYKFRSESVSDVLDLTRPIISDYVFGKGLNESIVARVKGEYIEVILHEIDGKWLPSVRTNLVDAPASTIDTALAERTPEGALVWGLCEALAPHILDLGL